MFEIPSQNGSHRGPYPERRDDRLGKFDRAVAEVVAASSTLFGPGARRYRSIPGAVADAAGAFRNMDDRQLTQAARKLAPELRREGLGLGRVARSFALVREAADRCLGMRHRDCQLVGGAVLLDRKVAEMETGEGKTLVATLAACTMALAGVPVHVITVNDYLAGRDAEWMKPVYEQLGISVGCVVGGMPPEQRRNAYRCDVTYCTNKEIVFDYLRDRIVLWDRPGPVRLRVERLYGKDSRLQRLLLRGLHFAIVDEADSVLIDEARTPLIISSGEEEIIGPAAYSFALALARRLEPKRDYRLLEAERKIELLAPGEEKVAEQDWRQVAPGLVEKQRNEITRLALVALHLFHPDRHYLVKDGRVQIIDEYTGRLMSDRSWSLGLHQLIEMKEGCELTLPRETRARISYQRFFRRYIGLAGMTGTAREVAHELASVYRLQVVSIPTHRPVQRREMPDRVCPTLEEKWAAIVDRTAGLNETGRPVLIGTRSVEASETISRHLKGAGLSHRVLNARQDEQEAEIIGEAGASGQITVATNMAGRGTDIRVEESALEAGGLHVIATERHEAGRIDRQLFGRCGRQGDPGSCEAVVSLEDDLICHHIPGWLRKLAFSALTASGGLGHRISRPLFVGAQRAVERQHEKIRRELLKYDQQLSRSLAFSGRSE